MAMAFAVIAAVAGGSPTLAQIVLPGAVAPSPEGSTQVLKPARPKSAASRPALREPGPVPNPAALAGKTLALDGGRSQATFSQHDKQIEVSRLILSGEMISNTRRACQVAAEAGPVAVKSLGRPNGVERVQIDFPACPLAFDILDGAVLVDRGQGVCEMKQADCRINPVGLWGPPAADLGPDKDKAIEHARAQAEAAVRANYKGLVASTKDRVAIMGFAREQAQFSSSREEICRDYAGEGQHGFCATKLTEARAVLLRAKLDQAAGAKIASKAKRPPGQVAKRP